MMSAFGEADIFQASLYLFVRLRVSLFCFHKRFALFLTDLTSLLWIFFEVCPPQQSRTVDQRLAVTSHSRPLKRFSPALSDDTSRR